MINAIVLKLSDSLNMYTEEEGIDGPLQERKRSASPSCDKFNSI